ncbi:hypothetical protein RUM43_011266 [Polyplax serrata]|uniref:Uncharacterized protein n=1 Tax=Polyplax serrata TaxID=468196 RepID=A0AAN8NLR7_POLSC
MFLFLLAIQATFDLMREALPTSWRLYRCLSVELVTCWSSKVSAVVAEWLRRLTRNQIPSGSVGNLRTVISLALELAKRFILRLTNILQKKKEKKNI